VKVYRSAAEAAGFGPAALSIGNFDGVHCGHRRILRRVRAIAAERGWHASVLTFDPHPARVVAPERAPLLLTTPEQRLELMAEEGIGQVLILPFTQAVAHWSPEEFVRSLLVDRLGVKAVLVGDNFRFGHGHAGDTAMLARLGRECGFATEIIPAVTLRGRVVSSSGVRQLIRAGEVSRAARFLTHPYRLEGRIVSGRGVGSRQTVPTLNLETAAEVLPARGVYVTRTEDPERGLRWESVTNVGFHPTFGAGERLAIETFLLDGLEGPAPESIRLEFLFRLREERTFPHAEALKQQIFQDVQCARRWFRRVARWVKR
jgi:riboflavin kinase/FMN adenylyltransferase